MVLRLVIGLERQDYELPEDLLKLELPGDWVVDKHASKDQLLAALAQIIKRDMGKDVSFEQRDVERKVFTLKGDNQTPDTGSAPISPLTSEDQARFFTVISDVQTLNSQIRMYAAQHEDRYPGMDSAGNFDPQLLISQLTSKTNAKGEPFDAGRDSQGYGPYLAKVPSNPFLSGNVAKEIKGGAGLAPFDDSSGWWFDTKTREFSANDSRSSIIANKSGSRKSAAPASAPTSAAAAQDSADFTLTGEIVNGRIVDNIDYPFRNDPNVIGLWKSVDFVTNISDFNPAKRSFKRDLFLKQLIFLPNGRMDQPWNSWTKGLVLNHGGDQVAEHYTIKNIDGTDYLFFEWKSGDYFMLGRKPMYYVLKREGSPPADLASAAARFPSDDQWRKEWPAKFEKLNINTADLDDVKTALGSPIQYIWQGKKWPASTPEAELGNAFIADYPEGVSVFFSKYVMDANQPVIIEVRYTHPGYFYAGKIQVGSPLEDVFKVVGEPRQTVDGGKCLFEDGVLYKNFEGSSGESYYGRQDKHVRFFFYDGKVVALYLTSDHYQPGTPKPATQSAPASQPTTPLSADKSELLQDWVEYFFQHNYRDITEREMVEWGQGQRDANGNLSIRYKYKATIWDKDIYLCNVVFTFTPAGEFVSANKLSEELVGHGPGPKLTPAPADGAAQEKWLKDRVEEFFSRNYIDVTSRQPISWGQLSRDDKGNFSITYKYLATIRDKDKLIIEDQFTFAPSGEFVNVKKLSKTPADNQSTTQPATQAAAPRAQLLPCTRPRRVGTRNWLKRFSAMAPTPRPAIKKAVPRCTWPPPAVIAKRLCTCSHPGLIRMPLMKKARPRWIWPPRAGTGK